MIDRLLPASFMVIGGMSARVRLDVARARSPRPIPWRCSSATTPRTCTAPSSRGTTSRPAWRCSSLGNCSSAHQYIADLVRADGRPCGAQVPPAALATFAHGGRPRHRHWRSASPGQSSPRARPPEWLTIPERGLYTGVAIFGAVGSGKTSACLHPFARQLFELARDESRAARGGAGPGSEGRCLPRHPPDADRAGPATRTTSSCRLTAG